VVVCVQASDLLWAGLILTGWEWVQYGDPVRSLADVHLVHMPYSHAFLSAGALALAGAGVAAIVWKRRGLALGIGVALLSHIVLDIAVHLPDIPLVPWASDPRLGSGLYGIPVWAFLVEVGYMAFAWKVGKGSRALLVTLVVLNLTLISVYVPAISGPEGLFPRYPDLFPVLTLVTMVLGSIAILHFKRAE
jgi:hypothetical protein